MNYELAVMALDGLAASPLTLRVDGETVSIEGSGASFKELARLCLLLGSEGTADGEEVSLSAGLHLTAGKALHLRRA